MLCSQASAAPGIGLEPSFGSVMTNPSKRASSILPSGSVSVSPGSNVFGSLPTVTKRILCRLAAASIEPPCLAVLPTVEVSPINTEILRTSATVIPRVFFMLRFSRAIGGRTGRNDVPFAELIQSEIAAGAADVTAEHDRPVLRCGCPTGYLSRCAARRAAQAVVQPSTQS